MNMRDGVPPVLLSFFIQFLTAICHMWYMYVSAHIHEMEAMEALVPIHHGDGQMGGSSSGVDWDAKIADPEACSHDQFE